MRSRHALTVAAVTTAIGCWATQASAYVYWGNSSSTTLGRAALDSSGVDQAFVSGATAPAGVAVDGQHVYWANFSAGTIGRANLDGTGVNQNFITGATFPFSVTVDAQHIYWTNEIVAGTIGRANLDGSGATQSFISGASFPEGVAVDGQYIYWSNWGAGAGSRLGRANLDGSNPTQGFITGADAPVGVAVDSRHIYWTNNGDGTIGRTNLDGSGTNQSFISGAQNVQEVTVDGQHIYWANSSAIGRASIDGSSPDQSFITGASGTVGVAVDEGPRGIATPSAGSVSFGTQPLGTLSAAQGLDITNTGHGNLQIDAARLTGGDVSDFVLSSDSCSGALLQIGGACTIHVRFDPSQTAARSVMLTVSSNDASGPLQIPVAGVGGQLPQGAAGPQGRPGKAAVVELVSCRIVTRTFLKKLHGKHKHKRVKVKRRLCTTRVLTGRVSFTTAAVERAAISSRAVITYARGLALHTATHPKLLLTEHGWPEAPRGERHARSPRSRCAKRSGPSHIGTLSGHRAVGLGWCFVRLSGRLTARHARSLQAVRSWHELERFGRALTQSVSQIATISSRAARR